jgi:hypothetical protein
VTASFADNEIWHVMIADDMKRMNLDQLDDAFRLSVVDASTLVWKAGMNTWRRLGSIADLDESEPAAHRAPPPPPRPLPPPAPARPAAFAPAPAFPVAPAKTSPLAPAFPAAPVKTLPLTAAYSPQLFAPNAYAPPRRAAFESEVDFRRRSGGVRWGRWFAASLVISVAFLAAYRQNLLRSGARALGLEQKYLHGEMRVTALVSQQAPAPLRSALARLGLLPGPNAAELAKSEHAAAPSEPARSTPAAVMATTSTAEPQAKAEPDIKTVSLDSLPLAGNNSAPAKSFAAPAPAVVPASSPASPVVAHPAEAKPAAPKPVALKAPAPEKPKAGGPLKAETTAAKAPQVVKTPPAPKAQPAPANESPLKAAIRSAIAADSKK